jgi:hypothetical protein
VALEERRRRPPRREALTIEAAMDGLDDRPRHARGPGEDRLDWPPDVHEPAHSITRPTGEAAENRRKSHETIA